MKNWIIVLFIAIGGCTRHPAPIPEIAKRNSYLIQNTWKLISTTRLDEQGAFKSVYNGTSRDSVIFDYNLILDSNNVKDTHVFTFLNNVKMSFPYDFYNVNDDLCYIKCYPSWQKNPTYSDTLMIDSISYDLLVFRVRYSDSTGKGIEIDSLKK